MPTPGHPNTSRKEQNVPNFDTHPHSDTPRDIDRENTQKLAKLREHIALVNTSPPQEDPYEEINRVIYESTALAERCEMFAAARSLAVQRPVLPLEPLSMTPMVPIDQASMDLPKLLEWWSKEPEANVGHLSGRLGRLVVIRLADDDAIRRLHDLARVSFTDPETDKTYTEVQELSGAMLSIGAPGDPVRVRSIPATWGDKKLNASFEKVLKEHGGLYAAERYLIWQHGDFTDMEAPRYDFRAKTLAEGVELLGNGQVILAHGHLANGLAARGNLIGRLPSPPAWFSAKYGKVVKVNAR
jgi:Bifunctional DNA primase/polymerase, N-terminal